MIVRATAAVCYHPGRMWKSRPVSKLVDDAVIGFGCVFSPIRILQLSRPGAPPTIAALEAEQAARPPEIRWPERLERRPGRIRMRMPVMGFDTFLDFHPARDPGADTLFIYHHGLREFPHDGSAARILGRGRLAERCDWVAIRGAHHDSRASVDARLTCSQESFARGLLSSVATVRAVARRLRGRYRHVVAGGMSMGGVIALIEAATGSAVDLTVPLMAGPDLEAVLLRSAFTRIVCPRYRARPASERFSSELDLAERLARTEGPPVRAVLSIDDQLFPFADQRAA
ncbi:MAG TPA: hypothetical protein VHF22_05095 [Planctomycetota bacterium]|nr:hypothetical protein [Planctomycetota bacterium]